MLRSHPFAFPTTPSLGRNTGSPATKTVLVFFLLLFTLCVRVAQAQIPAGGSGRVTATTANVNPYYFDPAMAGFGNGAYRSESWTIRNSSNVIVASFNVTRTNNTIIGGPFTSDQEGMGLIDPLNPWSTHVIYQNYAQTCGTGATVYIAVPKTAAPGNYSITFSEAYHNINSGTYGNRDSSATFTVTGSVSSAPPAPTLTLAGRARDNYYNGYNSGVNVTFSWTTQPGTVVYRLRRSLVPGGPYTDVYPGGIYTNPPFSNKYILDPSGGTSLSWLVSQQLSNSVNFNNGENQRTYFYVVTAVNAYGESASSNEVRSSPTSLTYIWQGASGNVPAYSTQGEEYAGEINRRWAIYTPSGTLVATGANGQSSNGWSASIVKSQSYVEGYYVYPACEPSYYVPGYWAVGYSISVTTALATPASPYPNYSVVSIADYPQYQQGGGFPQYQTRTEATSYFDVLGFVALYRLQMTQSGAVRGRISTDWSEVGSLMAAGWQYMGVMGLAYRDEFSDSTGGVTPIYVSTHPGGDTLYSKTSGDVQYAINTYGYTYQGIAFYLYSASAQNRKTLYRFVTPSNGLRIESTDPGEAANPPPTFVLEGPLGYTYQ